MKKANWIGFLPFYLLAVILFISAAAGTSQAVTTAVQRTAVHRNHVFIIDAGHGGVDGGATSCTGVLESQINLEISLKLNDLMHLLGYKTVMIRTEDVSIYTKGETIAAKKVSDLKERVRIVNETENAVLISIHQNTFSDSRYDGAQVFYADTSGSATLAQGLQSELTKSLDPTSNRKAKKATGVYLMEHIQKTGILVECGFLSNPEEEAKLRDPDYQRRLCSVIATTVSRLINT